MEIEFFDEFLGSGEDFGAFERRPSDGDFVMGRALMDGKLNDSEVVVPIESVFHLVAIEKLAAVGDNFREVDGNFVLTKNFLDEGLLRSEFVVVVEDLPRRVGEEEGVFRFDAVLRRAVDTGGDGFDVAGAFAGDVEV